MLPRFPSGAAVLLALAACPDATPDGGTTLLYFNRSPAARLGDRSWAADAAHSQLVAFDGRLRVVARFTDPRLAQPVAVAPLAGRLLVTERTGEGVVFDTAGRPVHEWESPLSGAALYTASGRRILAARSPYFVTPFATETASAPLVRVLDTLGRPIEGLGPTRLPDPPFLAQLVNAGAVALDEVGDWYFAPLVRDEIVKYTAGGTQRWTTRRGVIAHERDPVYLPARPARNEAPRLEVGHALVNLGLVLGPDGRLYVLGGDDSAATRLRLDVLDTATGAIVATRRLGSTESAIAIDARGLIVTYDAAELLNAEGKTAQAARPPFVPAFDLPDTVGDTVSLVRFAGKVTLVNFWASWCDPCREEFPHMAELHGRFGRRDFDIVAISDDVDRGKMLAFVREFRPPFPILVGAGRMKQQYHYRGLPYSVLLDRRGRIVERYFGFGGEAEFRRLAQAIAREIGPS
jgi:thiol-disulfide isomerase/thioredoxin